MREAVIVGVAFTLATMLVALGAQLGGQHVAITGERLRVTRSPKDTEPMRPRDRLLAGAVGVAVAATLWGIGAFFLSRPVTCDGQVMEPGDYCQSYDASGGVGEPESYDDVRRTSLYVGQALVAVAVPTAGWGLVLLGRGGAAVAAARRRRDARV